MRIFGLVLDIVFESRCMPRWAKVEQGLQVCLFVMSSMETQRERERERGLVEKLVYLFRRKDGMLHAYIGGKVMLI